MFYNADLNIFSLSCIKFRKSVNIAIKATTKSYWVTVMMHIFVVMYKYKINIFSVLRLKHLIDEHGN